MKKRRWWGSCKSCMFFDICPVPPEKVSSGCEDRAVYKEESADSMVEQGRDEFYREWWNYIAEDYDELNHLPHEQNYKTAGGVHYQ